MINERLNNNYDFLRIFAATCICFTHSFNLLNKDGFEPLMRISGSQYDFSFIGLSIFFSVSGYLITKSVYTSSSLQSYFWKRFLRIQPLLMIVCVLSVFIIGPVFTTLPATEYFKIPETYSYFRNIFPATGIQFVLPGVFADNFHPNVVNGSLWTLVVEERLYLLVSVFFFFKKQGKSFALLVLLFNIMVTLKSVFFQGSVLEYLKGSHIFYALLFLNAGALYQVGFDFKYFAKRKLSWIALFLLVLSFFYTFLQFLQVLIIPLCVIMVANVRAATNNAAKWGDFTYGVYIFSFPVQQIFIAIKLVPENPYLLFVVTMSTVLPLGALSWHLLEKKCLRHKDLVA